MLHTIRTTTKENTMSYWIDLSPAAIREASRDDLTNDECHLIADALMNDDFVWRFIRTLADEIVADRAA